MPWFGSRICCQILLLHKYTSEPKLLVLDIVNLTLRNKCSSSVYLYSDSVLSDFSGKSFGEYELPHFSEVSLDFYITLFTVFLLIIRHLQQKSYITAFRRAWLLGGIRAWHLEVMEITSFEVSRSYWCSTPLKLRSLSIVLRNLDLDATAGGCVSWAEGV